MYNLMQAGAVAPIISETILLYYIAHCHGILGLTYATIKLYLAGIRHFYIAQGLHNPFTDIYGQPLVQLQAVL